MQNKIDIDNMKNTSEVKNDAGAKDKEITLSDEWTIKKSPLDYMLTNKGVFIHGDRIKLATKNKENTWLNIYQDDSYIASVWLDSSFTIRKVKKFMKGD